MAITATVVPASAAQVDCAREPIHIPGTIQPHGVLLVLGGDRRISQCSANVEGFLNIPVERALGSSLSDLVGAEPASLMHTTLDHERLENNPLVLDKVSIRGRWFNVVIHQRDELTIAELEAAHEDAGLLVARVYSTFSRSVANLQQRLSLQELLQTATHEIHKLTNFDRVLLYQFGPDWAGTVVAETRTDRLPSYMDLRFPEADIPRQARELYRLNRIRLIADANYAPVPIVPAVNPLTGRTPDLTYSTLRSVSPIHVEYLKNMGAAASMSVSILRDGELWGLIACHHHAAARVPVQVRFACELVAQVLASQLAAAGERASAIRRAQLAASQQRMLERLSDAESFVNAIVTNSHDMLHCVGAEGAAVLFEDHCEVMGRAPTPEQVRELAAWIAGQPAEDVFVSSELSHKFAAAAVYRGIASGVLAVSISEINLGYLFWFRPEKAADVKWAGNPHKIEVMIDGRFHPRKSFETWTEREQGRSQRWETAEVESAVAFRGAVINLVLKKAQALAALSEDLQRTNSELEAFSYSVSHDLRAPFRHIIGYSEILREDDSIAGENRRYVETIIDSANYAGLLVDNLLLFARVSRSKLNCEPVSMKHLAEHVVRTVASENPNRVIDWTVGDLPNVMGDAFFIRLVLYNLVRNAVKYTRPRQNAKIEICAQPEQSDEHVMFIRDNGVGFDMQFVHKLFGVFQRLHSAEEFEGTGIGLATVSRIISRHGGKVWAAGEVNVGATFFFTLPRTVSSER